MLDSFRLPAFRLLFVNGLLSSAAMSVTMLVHSWLILSLTDDSAFWVGVSVALHGIGQVLFAVAGGVLVDQLDRRRLLFAEQLFGGTAYGFLAGMSYLGLATLPMALALSFAMGATLTLERTTTNALVSDVAGDEGLLNALSWRRVAILPVMVGGSLLIGTLLAGVGTWAGYAVVSGALLVAPWVLLRLPAGDRIPTGRPNFFRQVSQGMLYAARDWQVRTLLLIAVGMEAFGFSYTTMIPVMAKNVLDVGAIGLGQISAASGVGAGVGILGVAALGNFRNKPRLILLAASIAGASLLGFSLSESLPMAMLFALLTTGSLMAYDITIGALLLIVAPPHMRGRIISLHSLAIAFMSLGGFATGALGSLVGVPVMLTLGSAAITGNLLLHRRRLLRIREPNGRARAPVVGSRASEAPGR